jgi:pimeloyl-ACP methyl ester carboxylesterase
MASTLLTLRCATRFVKWLGPWTSDTEMPEHVIRRTTEIKPVKPGDRPLEAWVYKPKNEAPMGAILVTPGLFPDGPEDRRLDRISRIFAASGMLVLTPFLPDFMSLRLSPRVIDDVDRAFGTLLEQPELPVDVLPGIFSVSFGSLPALSVASAPHRADQVGALMVWGGYADWRETMHFAFTGEVNGQRFASYDPTNHPVIFMNLISQMPEVPVDPEILIQAWRKFVLSTWNKPEQKKRFREVAQEIADGLPAEARRLFLIGCGAESGGYELCARLLAQARSEFLDPRPSLVGLRCPVHLIHARNDDVIPANQLDHLVAAMPPHVQLSTHLTGVYGHSGGRGQGGGGLSLTPSLLREVMTMAGILRSFSKLGLSRRRPQHSTVNPPRPAAIP